MLITHVVLPWIPITIYLRLIEKMYNETNEMFHGFKNKKIKDFSDERWDKIQSGSVDAFYKETGQEDLTVVRKQQLQTV
jgi:hypothetical protein